MVKDNIKQARRQVPNKFPFLSHVLFWLGVLLLNVLSGPIEIFYHNFVYGISQIIPQKTILTTAYRNYALESYDLDVVDYLLNPITFDRFFKAVGRYFRDTPIRPPVVSSPLPSSNTAGEESFIIIKSGNKHHKVAINTILYVESLKDYIKVHTESNRIVSKYKISDLEKELTGKPFLRVHRSYIVNINKVTAFTPHDVEIDTVEIPIGISYKGKVLAVLNQA